MEHFKNELWNEYQASLQEINSSSLNTYQKASAYLKLSRTTLSKIEVFLSEHSFKDDEEEIHFFKEIKPLFLKEVIYHSELFYFESNRPAHSKPKIQHFIKDQLLLLDAFINKHKSFYNYYRLGLNDKDLTYFKKSSNLSEPAPPDCINLDCNSAVPYGDLLAKLLAYDKLSTYYHKGLDKIKGHPVAEDEPSQKPNDHFVWTESKAALIELAYALYAKGSVNFGACNIKQIIEQFEVLFNVKLGNFYRVYMDMLIRKKGRTPFLDSLKDYLERRMDEAD
jgi:hypothetical protein